MESPAAAAIVQVTIHVLAFGLFVIWAFRRVRRRRPRNEFGGSLSLQQIFGIFGIVLFLVPTLVVTIFTPVRLVLVGLRSLLDLTDLSPWAHRLVQDVLGAAGLAVAFGLVFFIVELIWPKRRGTADDGGDVVAHEETGSPTAAGDG